MFYGIDIRLEKICNYSIPKFAQIPKNLLDPAAAIKLLFTVIGNDSGETMFNKYRLHFFSIHLFLRRDT